MADTASPMSREKQREEYVRRYLKAKGPALAEIHETWDFDQNELEEPGDQSEQFRYTSLFSYR